MYIYMILSFSHFVSCFFVYISHFFPSAFRPFVHIDGSSFIISFPSFSCLYIHIYVWIYVCMYVCEMSISISHIFVFSLLPTHARPRERKEEGSLWFFFFCFLFFFRLCRWKIARSTTPSSLRLYIRWFVHGATLPSISFSTSQPTHPTRVYSRTHPTTQCVHPFALFHSRHSYIREGLQ